MTLTKEDILEAIKLLVELRNGRGAMMTLIIWEIEGLDALVTGRKSVSVWSCKS